MGIQTSKSPATAWPGLIAAGLLLGLVPLAVQSAERPPNVVLIFVDDIGCADIGNDGKQLAPTPHIDAIASSGVRFTSGYVTSPFCAPSRAGLMTGKFQTRFGYDFNPVELHNLNPSVGLPRNQQTMAAALRNSGGYATALIGKWHLGGAPEYHPMLRGFDEYFGFLHEGHSYAFPEWNGVTSFIARRTLPGGGQGRWVGDGVVYTTEKGPYLPVYDANNPILRASQPVVETEYLTDAFTREAISFIERRKKEPFFLLVAYSAVHTPLQGANGYVERFAHIEDVESRILAAMLSNLDDGIGAIVDKLHATGLEEDTMVIFLSDNGAPTYWRKHGNGALRGGKGEMYEGGIRVPFMVQWKGRIPAGQVIDQPVIATDLFPTIAAAAGASYPRNLDGIDLMPLLTGQEKEWPTRPFFWRMGERTALRIGHWKLVNDRPDRKEWELYDLSRDIGEQNNLIDANPEKANEMEAVWQSLNSEMAEPIFRYN